MVIVSYVMWWRHNAHACILTSWTAVFVRGHRRTHNHHHRHHHYHHYYSLALVWNKDYYLRRWSTEWTDPLAADYVAEYQAVHPYAVPRVPIRPLTGGDIRVATRTTVVMSCTVRRVTVACVRTTYNEAEIGTGNDTMYLSSVHL